jgi:hypothetical protein
MAETAANPTDYVAQQLDLYTTAALQQIASTLGVPTHGNQRLPMIAALSRMIGSPPHLDLLQHRLVPEHWAVLDLLPLRMGPVALRSLVVVLRDRGLEGRAALDVLSPLLSHACLLPIGPLSPTRIGVDVGDRSFSGGRTFFELAPGVAALAREHDPTPLVLTPVDPPAEVLGSALLDLQRTMFVLIAEAGRKPFKLTNAGAPYKSDLSRVAKALAAAGGIRPEAGGLAVDSSSVPPLLWLAAAVCAEVGLLEEVDGMLRPGEGAGEVLAGTLEDQVATFFSAWTDSAFNDFAQIPTLTSYSQTPLREPWLRPLDEVQPSLLDREHLAAARDLVCGALLHALAADPDAWYGLGELAKVIQQQAPEILFTRDNDYELFHAHLYPHFRYTTRYQYPGIIRKLGRPPTSAGEYTLYVDTDWPEVEGAFVRQVVGETMRWLGAVDVDRPPSGRPWTAPRSTD